MKSGDLVIRKVDPVVSPGRDMLYQKIAIRQRDQLGHGMVLSRQLAGSPKHWCVSVWYPKVGRVYDIAEELMEVISVA